MKRIILLLIMIGSILSIFGVVIVSAQSFDIFEGCCCTTGIILASIVGIVGLLYIRKRNEEK